MDQSIVCIDVYEKWLENQLKAKIIATVLITTAR